VTNLTGTIARLAATALSAYGRPPVNTMAISVGTIVAVLCLILAFWLVLAGFACTAAAVWIFAQPTAGSLGAALITAAVLLIACLALAVTAWAVLRSKPKAASTQALPISPDQLLAQGLQLFKEHKGAVLLAALLAGMVSETQSRS
jgi:hypothetical protein